MRQLNLRNALGGQPMGLPIEQDLQQESQYPGVGLMASYMQAPPQPREQLPVLQVAAGDDHFKVKKPAPAPATKWANEIAVLDQRLDDLMEIKARFNPTFQTFQKRSEMGGRQIWDMAQGDLTPQERQELEEYTAFTSSSSGIMSLILKDLSGAQVSGHEERRIRNMLPSSGEGFLWFTNADSPITYEAKLNRFISSTRRARHRYFYLLENGIPPSPDVYDQQMPLFDLEAPMWKRAAGERAQRYMDGGMGQEEAIRRARMDLGIGDQY